MPLNIKTNIFDILYYNNSFFGKNYIFSRNSFNLTIIDNRFVYSFFFYLKQNIHFFCENTSVRWNQVLFINLFFTNILSFAIATEYFF